MAKVLAIDDEPNDRTLIEMLLSRREYDVVFADNGWKGLQLDRQEHPDITLKMPNQSFLKFLTTTRAFPRSHSAYFCQHAGHPAPHFNWRSYAMIARMRLEEAISETLQKTDPCCLDVLVRTLPNFSWGEVFLAVDRMSRDGRVFLRQLGYSTYQISLDSQFAYSSSTSGRTERTTRGAMPIIQVTAQCVKGEPQAERLP